MVATLVDFRDVTIAAFAIAAVVTTLRAALRFNKQLWWWDDTFAVIAIVVNTIYVAGACLLSQGGNATRTTQVAAYYIVVAGYYIPLWCSRLSILFTIIRITPWPHQQRILLYCAGFFAFQFTLLMVQAFWVCEITATAWKSIPGALCALGRAVPITQVITTMIADVILIGAPLWILRKTRLNAAVRFRLISVFSLSIATTMAAIAHAVLVVRLPGAWEAIFASVEVFVTLTVSNASVLIPAVARRFSNNETYTETKNTATRTLGGGERKPGGEVTVLSTLRIADMSSNSIQRDDSAAWESKDRVTEDDESANNKHVYNPE